MEIIEKRKGRGQSQLAVLLGIDEEKSVWYGYMYVTSPLVTYQYKFRERRRGKSAFVGVGNGILYSFSS